MQPRKEESWEVFFLPEMALRSLKTAQGSERGDRLEQVAFQVADLAIEMTEDAQVRSQKFVIGGGGCLGGLGAEPPAAGGQWGSGGEAPSCRRLGDWGQSPQSPEARGSGGSAPSDQKFCIFLLK